MGSESGPQGTTSGANEDMASTEATSSTILDIFRQIFRIDPATLQLPEDDLFKVPDEDNDQDFERCLDQINAALDQEKEQCNAEFLAECVANALEGTAMQKIPDKTKAEILKELEEVEAQLQFPNRLTMRDVFGKMSPSPGGDVTNNARSSSPSNPIGATGEMEHPPMSQLPQQNASASTEELEEVRPEDDAKDGAPASKKKKIGQQSATDPDTAQSSAEKVRVPSPGPPASSGSSTAAEEGSSPAMGVAPLPATPPILSSSSSAGGEMQLVHRKRGG